MFYSKIKTLVFVLAASLALTSCSDDENPDASNAPIISNFSPSSALPGETVTVSGEHFNASPSGNAVKFNGEAGVVTQATTTQLQVTVPASATTGKISVIVNGKTVVSANDFTVLQTTITGFSPTSGLVGTVITINGNNFSTVAGDNVVKINGVQAAVSAATATQLTAVVPAETTTGKISITLNGTTITSVEDFTVLSPTIESYFPPIAAPGITVIITGSNFSAIPSNNMVKFNGTVATVTAASETSLSVTVPAGATTGSLSVKVGPHTATASTDFEMCTGSAELIISDVVISNTSGASSYFVSFKITNVGSTNADVSKIVMQNYAVQDESGSNAVAASGYTLSSAPVLAPGESYTTPNFSASIAVQNTTTRPYLQITLSDNPDGDIPECNLDNNIVISPFNQ